MGYISYLTGEITIDPPLTNAEIRESGLLASKGSWLDVKLRIGEQQVETDDGTLLRRTADALIPGTEDGFKAYEFGSHLAAAVRKLDDGTRHLTGEIVRVGGDAGDVERWIVRDGQITSEQAKLIWPDGSEVQL